MKRTYLSIDLDYWLAPDDHYVDYNNPTIEQFHTFMRSLDFIKDRCIVDSHDHILSHINNIAPKKIIHVDYHQDIAYPYDIYKNVTLHEGTFFYFVENRNKIDYIWYYPDKKSLDFGLCVLPSAKPFSKKNFIFKNQNRSKGLPTNDVLKDVVALGFSISTDYLDTITKDELIKLLIPYFKLQDIEAALSENNII